MKRGSVMLAALLLTGFATATTATAAPAIAWHECEENSAVECASVTVPIDYANPATGTVDIAIARVKATDRKQGTLFYMPGGPGDSGVEQIQDRVLVPEDVAERFDVVTFDPRGTNGSHPIICDTELTAMPNVIPEAGARLAEVQQWSRDLGENCRMRTGPLIDHVDSISVARDIDMIRAALGERKLTLYGRSWGTLAGQMYAENFPHRVRGLVLDSVFDHSLSLTKLVTTQSATAEDSFTEFAKWCAANTTCALHGQDVGQVYGDVYEKTVSGELPVPTLAMNDKLVRLLYRPDWPGAANLLKQLSESSTRAAATTTEFSIAVFCADHRLRINSQAEWMSLWRKQNAAAPTLRTHLVWLVVSLCSAWPAATPNPQHRTDVDDSVPPILIMNSLHDPATSYEWAKSVNRQIDRSVLLTYDGWGHGVTNRTDCTKAVFTNYVLHGRTPRPGTHCPAA